MTICIYIRREEYGNYNARDLIVKYVQFVLISILKFIYQRVLSDKRGHINKKFYSQDVIIPTSSKE